MAKVAYRFLFWDGDGPLPKNNPSHTLIRDAAEILQPGSVVRANLLGHRQWEVVEVRETETPPPLRTTDAAGRSIPLGGTVVCRPLR